VGGTASELSGGKFSNGALTGAFSRAFNDEATERAQEEQLPEIFYNKKFRFQLNLGLGRSIRAVESDPSGTYGLAIKPDGEGGFNFGEYPNNSPSTNTVRGLEDGVFFATGLQPIVGASALAISLPPWVRNNTILARTGDFQELSISVNAPVVVTSVSANTFVFVGNRDPIPYDPRK